MALARNFAIDDPRSFAVYLAWFGPELVKVGLTASERGIDRLLEQGALAYTWLARGGFRPARRLEAAAAATGAVRERIGRRAKISSWGDPPAPDAARSELRACDQRLNEQLEWPAALEPVACDVAELPAYETLRRLSLDLDAEVTDLADGAVLAGDVVFVAGHDAALATSSMSLAVDLRMLAGWTITTAEPGAGLMGVGTVPITRAVHVDQCSLF